MDWTGDAKQTVPSHAILQGVHTMSSVLHSARKRYGKWWLTGFQVTTQRLVMQKEFSGESSSNHQEEMALEICRNTRDRCPLGGGVAIWKLPQHLSYFPCHPPYRHLSMMLMLALSNPQLFALIGTQANVTKELERVEHQSRLEQLSPSDLQRKNRDHWEAWLQEYR